MKTIASLALAATFAVLLAPGRVSASTVSDCQAQIAALSAATSATTFARDDQGLKTQAKLIFYLDKATGQLAKGDVRDALRQMKDYASDLANAVESGKLTAEQAAPLGTAAAGIVACIEGIQ